jgi:hypothetical protein
MKTVVSCVHISQFICHVIQVHYPSHLEIKLHSLLSMSFEKLNPFIAIIPNISNN